MILMTQIKLNEGESVEQIVFNSPQTGSRYTLVGIFGPYSLAFRVIGDDRYRVRVQGPFEKLEEVRDKLNMAYGETGEDHLSVVVDQAELVGRLREIANVLMEHVVVADADENVSDDSHDNNDDDGDNVGFEVDDEEV